MIGTQERCEPEPAVPRSSSRNASCEERALASAPDHVTGVIAASFLSLTSRDGLTSATMSLVIDAMIAKSSALGTSSKMTPRLKRRSGTPRCT